MLVLWYYADDDEVKRLEFKKKLFEIASFRNYDLEKTTELFIFVKELIQLSSELENEFDNFVVELLKKGEENMRVASPRIASILEYDEDFVTEILSKYKND